MASFLNTGILGQQVGGSLQVGSLRGEFTSFREEVLSNKKRRRTTTRADIKNEEQYLTDAQKARKGEVTASKRAIAAKEAESLRLRQEKLKGPDTSDVNKGITKFTKEVTGVSPGKLKPEVSEATDADRTFAQAVSSWNEHIQSKNESDINRGASQTQGYLQSVLDAAQATGREDVIRAVGGIEGILGQNNISARNVGQAKASTTKALGAIRGSLDIERILQSMAESSPKAGKKNAGGIAMTGAKKLTSRARVFRDVS